MAANDKSKDRSSLTCHISERRYRQLADVKIVGINASVKNLTPSVILESPDSLLDLESARN